MYVKSFSPEQSPVQVPVTEPKVAVLLNGNARQVSDKVKRMLSHAVPEGDLYFSRSFAEARTIAQQVVERRYDTVFTGGGDGTFVGFLNEILALTETRPGTIPLNPPRLPRFGVLKLGKGETVTVTVSNKDTDGYVVVDGVKLLKK